MLIPFFNNLKSGDSNISILIKAFITASFLSAFIYFEHYGYTNLTINTLCAILGVLLIIFIDRKSLFLSGFFVGIFWFYWISYSFIYYDLAYLKYPIIIGIALFYGVLFLFTSIINHFLIRLILFFSLSFIHPFGFNWFKPELIFLNTYFNTFEISTKAPEIKIYTPQFYINQNDKWKIENRETIVFENIKEINYAIKNGYNLIVLPETSLPLVLEYHQDIMNILKEQSIYIDIIVGSLSISEKNKYLNSTYHFSNGDFTIANKVELVPFGESVPLPDFMVEFINDIFFNGASDYQSVSQPTTFDIKGLKFRNAICYEATSNSVYKNLDTNFVIATSNNAWFTPSIEPTLQKLLLKYYAYKYNLYIIHSVNGSLNYIIQ